jgi:radical SAM superfamily enzyme YgiQ (UPF0313 family)
VSAAPHVLLINPTITSRRSARFPLAVLSLSAALDGKYTSTILDGNIDRDFVSTAARMVADGSVAAVGVTVMGGPQLTGAIAASKAIRARAPSIPIIWGGAFPTVCPEAALNSPYVDYAVRSQGQDTLIELLDSLSAGRTQDLSSITGLSWRQDGTVIHNKDRVFSTATLGRMLPYERLQNPRAGARQATRPHWVAGTAAPSVGLPRCFGARPRCRPPNGSRRTWVS